MLVSLLNSIASTDLNRFPVDRKGGYVQVYILLVVDDALSSATEKRNFDVSPLFRIKCMVQYEH